MRINIIGNTGSGESTLARRLSGKLDTLYVEMDVLLYPHAFSGCKARLSPSKAQRGALAWTRIPKEIRTYSA